MESNDAARKCEDPGRKIRDWKLAKGRDYFIRKVGKKASEEECHKRWMTFKSLLQLDREYVTSEHCSFSLSA